MKTFVIAGDNWQAKHWIDENIKKRYKAGDTSLTLSDYVYVSSPEKLKGINEPHGVFVGTWYERPDMLEVIQTLRHRTWAKNEKLNIIMDLYMQYRLGFEK